MADIVEWDPVDDANTDAPPHGWPEFMQPSAVNNSARAMMGAIKRWYNTVTAQLSGLTTTVNNKVSKTGDVMTGDLAISPTSGNAGLTLNKAAAGYNQIFGNTNGVQRWLMRLGGIGEVGGNQGANFELHRYADNGSYLGPVMTASRMDGTVAFNSAVTLVTGASAGYQATRRDYVDQRDTDWYNAAWANITTWAANADNTVYTNATNYALGLHNSQQADVNNRVYRGGDTMSGGLTAAGLGSTGDLNVNGNATIGAVLIAHDVMPSADNVSICGGAASAWNVVEAYNFITKSDIALKQDVGAMPDTLPLIAAVVPKAFQYIGDDDRRHWGFVAQDVRAATSDYPVDLVTGEEGRLGLDYSGMTAVLWKAVQELTERLAVLEGRP